MIVNRIVRWAAAGVLALGVLPAIGFARQHTSLPTSDVTMTPTGVLPVSMSSTVKKSSRRSVHRTSARAHRASARAHKATAASKRSVRRSAARSHAKVSRSHVRASASHAKSLHRSAASRKATRAHHRRHKSRQA